MRIELHDENRERIGRIEVDPTLRPTRVSIVNSDREVFLNWDIALDDAGCLRRCVACSCTDLFREKTFPQITILVVALAFAGAVVSALGLVNTPLLIAMCVVLALDIAILVVSRRRLVCYRCRTAYHGLPIARYHRRWDPSTAQRYVRRAPLDTASSTWPIRNPFRPRPSTASAKAAARTEKARRESVA